MALGYVIIAIYGSAFIYAIWSYIKG